MLSFSDAEESNRAALSFVTSPAFFAALAFACGIALSATIVRPPAWLLLSSGAGFVSALLCFRVAQWLGRTALLLAWFAAGMFCATVQQQPLPAPALQAALLEQDTLQQVTGVVQGKPRFHHDSTSGEASKFREKTQVLDIQMTQLNGEAVASRYGTQIARITVLLSEDSTAPVCGSAARFAAKLHAPPRYYTPAAWNEAAWLAQQQIFAEGSVRAEAIQPVGARINSFACRVAVAGDTSMERLDLVVEKMSAWPPRWRFATLSLRDADLLAAALLGDRSRLDPADASAFQRVRRLSSSCGQRAERRHSRSHVLVGVAIAALQPRCRDHRHSGAAHGLCGIDGHAPANPTRTVDDCNLYGGAAALSPD